MNKLLPLCVLLLVHGVGSCYAAGLSVTSGSPGLAGVSGKRASGSKTGYPEIDGGTMPGLPMHTTGFLTREAGPSANSMLSGSQSLATSKTTPGMSSLGAASSSAQTRVVVKRSAPRKLATSSGASAAAAASSVLAKHD
jgi:hypothetical protein